MEELASPCRVVGLSTLVESTTVAAVAVTKLGASNPRLMDPRREQELGLVDPPDEVGLVCPCLSLVPFGTQPDGSSEENRRRSEPEKSWNGPQL